MANIYTTISLDQLKELLEGKEIFRKDAIISFPIEIFMPEKAGEGK